MLTELAAFVCSVYCPKGFNIESIPELRWHLFCKHMAESTKLPPTLGALKQQTLRVHIQCNVWGQCDVFHQEFLDPLQNDLYKEPSGEVKPVTTDVLPAPKAIIEMVRCLCTTNCSSRGVPAKQQVYPVQTCATVILISVRMTTTIIPLANKSQMMKMTMNLSK